MAIAWITVGSIVSRVVARSRDENRLVGLRRIGIDEFSYRKRHRYLTVVVDHDRKRVVWACEGRSAEALNGFFEALGEEGRASIRTVTMDMAGGYIKAIHDWLPEARIVFDRFHVQQLASKALDKVRRRLVKALGGPQAARGVKNLRWVLLRYGPDLDIDDIDRLEEVRSIDRRLWRAYQGKEELVAIFDEEDKDRAELLLRRWLAWAARSRIQELVQVGKTIRTHLTGILEYFQERLTNGLVEGINNKLRVVARRAYGFHSAGALIAMLFLVAGGITLNPVLPKPTCS
jgi:transposase